MSGRPRVLLPVALVGLAATLGRVGGEGEGPAEPRQVTAALSRTQARAAARAAPAVVRIRPAGEDVAAATQRVRSGVVIAPELVATDAAHVGVVGLDDLVVETADGRTFPARLRGRDLRTRIVLLEAPDLDVAPPEVSPGPHPAGTVVLAQGAVLSSEGTATSGIVSATGRFQGRALQTDAELDASNTGGALVDLEGRLIGVLVRIDERLGERSGVGFAVPVPRIRAVLDELIAGRELAPGWLGLVVPSFDDGADGVRVRGTVPGGPCAAAGVETDDVVVAIDDRPTPDRESFGDVVADLYAGQEITLTVLRDGARREIVVRVGARD